MTRPDKFCPKFLGKNDDQTKNCQQNNGFNENLSGLCAKMRFADSRQQENLPGSYPKFSFQEVFGR
jgi:hypothetical protein